MNDVLIAEMPELERVPTFRLRNYLIMDYEGSYAVYEIQDTERRELRWHASRPTLPEAVEWIEQQGRNP